MCIKQQLTKSFTKKGHFCELVSTTEAGCSEVSHTH